ncbi:MAG: hypothetical protein AAFX06_28715 [Planctomycetota bacterium]
MVLVRTLSFLIALAVAPNVVVAQPPEPEAESGGRLEGFSESQTLREALEMLQGEPESLDSELGDEPIEPEPGDESIFAGRSTSLVAGRLTLPPIQAATTRTSAIGNGRTPVGFRGGADAPAIDLPETGEERGLPWQWQTGSWAPTNSFFHPLYFEDRMLERHGHQRYPALQPMISGGRFVAQWVALPYLSTLHPPCECDYSLGYYRSGSCAPVLRQRAPWSRKAAAAQATSVVGGFWALP